MHCIGDYFVNELEYIYICTCQEKQRLILSIIMCIAQLEE